MFLSFGKKCTQKETFTGGKIICDSLKEVLKKTEVWYLRI